MTDVDNIAINFKNVSKTFKLPHEKAGSIKNVLINFRQRKRGYEKQHVLNDVSFEVKKGEFFGIVGRNGSGKSTLLKLLAGIYAPDSGIIQVEGKLTPFIELGVGFNPELTGRENVFLNGALLGFNRQEMEAMYQDIVEFAELGRFMDQKLKNYSSGMQVRLAFSIAIRAQGDVLVLDEVLAVGDAAFQKKCYDYFQKLKKDKQTVVFISHDMNAVREYCDRAVLLDNGTIKFSGSASKAAEAYTKMFTKLNRTTASSEGKRWGTGDAHIKSADISQSKHDITITTSNQFKQAINQPVFGLVITSPTGVKLVETNTKWMHLNTGQIKKGQEVSVTWKVPNIFTNGINYVTLAISDNLGSEFFDSWEDAATFAIDKDDVTTAATLPGTKVDLRVIT